MTFNLDIWLIGSCLTVNVIGQSSRSHDENKSSATPWMANRGWKADL